MQLIEGLEGVDALELGERYGQRLESHSAVAVGVFDGVHLGHQRLLHQLLELAARHGALPTVVTFTNHPDELLRGNAPPLLVSVPHRLRLLRRAGVKRLIALQFGPDIRNMTAQEFAERVLKRGLRSRALLLGYDSAMGKNREGTPARFRELGTAMGFSVTEGEPFLVGGEPVSSTKIRAAIQEGRLADAQRFLGRWPSVVGEVLRGEGRGAGLGFPTANLMPEAPVTPPHGVYAVQVIRGGETLPGVANLGQRPTFEGATAPNPNLEVHLFDFSGDLYGETLEVCFLAQLREERRFASPEELQRQVQLDMAAARRALSE